MPDSGSRPGSRSWSGAGVSGVVVTAVLVLAFFYIPHWLLVRLASPAREQRALLAAGWTAIALVLAGWWAWRSTGPAAEAR